MRYQTTHSTLVMAGVVLSCMVAMARGGEDVENKQVLATSPEELIEMLEDISFLPPAEYRQKLEDGRNAHSFAIGLPQLPQKLDVNADPRRLITAEQLEAYAQVLTDIARESKRDGEILWGRIQGTKYERKAHQWIFNELRSMGFESLHFDKFPSSTSQWRPTRCDLSIVAAPSFELDQSYHFEDAITAFVSATTPLEGIRAPAIYVGDGTAAELQGRDLTDKIVLLRGRTQPSALMNSARTAYSRLATGRYGMPAGVVVWWDVPGVKQVAGRVGAPGGGDAIGKALPWTSIGDDAGLYLRKLLDRASVAHPVVLELNVQGRMEPSAERVSGNVYGILPGQSGKYIVIPSHVDGYFYGIHDNGASVALNLALADYYINIPFKERQHGLIFLFQGNHEVPGVGGTLPFIEKHTQLMKENLLLVLRPEHLGTMRQLDESIYVARSNVTDPLMLLVSNRSPLLIDIFKRAAMNYSIPMGDLVYADPAADEAAFHPPYNDLGAISSDWIITGKFYHSTADVDLGGVDFHQMEKITRAHAYIVDELFKVKRKELDVGAHPVPEKSIYQSDLIKIIMDNN